MRGTVSNATRASCKWLSSPCSPLAGMVGSADAVGLLPRRSRASTWKHLLPPSPNLSRVAIGECLDPDIKSSFWITDVEITQNNAPLGYKGQCGFRGKCQNDFDHHYLVESSRLYVHLFIMAVTSEPNVSQMFILMQMTDPPAFFV